METVQDRPKGIRVDRWYEQSPKKSIKKRRTQPVGQRRRVIQVREISSLNWLDLIGNRRQRIHHTDHAVTAHQLGEFGLAPVLGSFRTKR